jgi:hypothetical protein
MKWGMVLASFVTTSLPGLDQSDRLGTSEHGSSVRRLVEDDGDPVGIDDDEGVASVLGRERLHCVSDHGLDVLLREGLGDQAVDFDGHFSFVRHRFGYLGNNGLRG